MKQQKLPFTVTVKRRRRKPTSSSLFPDALANEPNAAKADRGSTPDRRRWREPPELAAIGRAPEVNPAELNDTAKPASRREPRILEAPVPEWKVAPVEEPRRGPGRPCKHPRPDETLPDKSTRRPADTVSADRSEPRSDAETATSSVSKPIGGPAPQRPAGAPQPVDDDANMVASPPVPQDLTPRERRSSRKDRWRKRRAVASAGLKRGERWKRHLPRWSR